MRTLFALLSGIVLFGVAVVNERQSSIADETVAAEQETVEQEAVAVEKPTVIRLPVVVSETVSVPTPAIHIDDELQEKIDELDERVSNLETSAVQVGRVAMIEQQLEDMHLRIDETQALLTNAVIELKAAIAAIPAPVVAESLPIESDWQSRENEKYLLLFTTTDCTPCETAKNELVPWLEDAGWKIQVFDPDAPEQEQFNVTGPFPTWIGLRNGNEVVRWTGASKPAAREILLDVYGYGTSITQSAMSEAVAPENEISLKSWIQSHSDGGDWTYPGDIRGHLLEHGWSASQIAGLTTSEMVELHDATHEGRISPSSNIANLATASPANRRTSSAVQSSYYTSSYSSCPSGGCPQSSYGRNYSNRRYARRAGAYRGGWFNW